MTFEKEDNFQKVVGSCKSHPKGATLARTDNFEKSSMLARVIFDTEELVLYLQENPKLFCLDKSQLISAKMNQCTIFEKKD